LEFLGSVPPREAADSLRRGDVVPVRSFKVFGVHCIHHVPPTRSDVQVGTRRSGAMTRAGREVSNGGFSGQLMAAAQPVEAAPVRKRAFQIGVGSTVLERSHKAPFLSRSAGDTVASLSPRAIILLFSVVPWFGDNDADLPRPRGDWLPVVPVDRLEHCTHLPICLIHNIDEFD
jgi:hypothetical protein